MVDKLIFIIFSLVLIGCSCSPSTEEENNDCSVKNNCNSEQQCLNKECVALECSPNGINDSCGNGNTCYNGKCITPNCSPERDRTICGIGNICLNGKCQKDPYYCSVDVPYGICEENKKCYNGECKEFVECSTQNPKGECTNTWEECIEGVCKAKVSKRIYPTQEDTLNIKLNEPVNSNKFYLYLHILPKNGYENYSDKRMFGAYDWEEKKITHLFSYKKNITGQIIENPKNNKYYYFDWWPDSINDVELVELDPKVGKLTKKRGFDKIPYDTEMWYISPSGKALIDTHIGCRTADDKVGYRVLVYDIEKDIKTPWCLEGDIIKFYSLENGDLYGELKLYDFDEDGNSTTIVYKLDIDNFTSKEVYRAKSFDKSNNLAFSEDGLLFYTKFDYKTKIRTPMIVDLFLSTAKELNFNFKSDFLDNDRQVYYLSPVFSNGKKLFLTLWVLEYEHPLDYEGSNHRIGKKKITIALDLKTLKYEVIDMSIRDSNSYPHLSSYYVYHKKYNIIRRSMTIFDLNSLTYYWMSKISSH